MGLPEGSQLGGYTIAGPLGSGGMGEVYRAYDRRLDRHVAIKLVRGDRISEPAFRLLAREARAASALNHTGIVTIYELGASGGMTWVAMELAEGGSLRQLLQREGTLPVARAREILVQLASALAAAHARGIAHRDLKPENVVFSHDMSTTKIVDFGLALRAIRPPVSNTSPTESLHAGDAAAFGTPAYMSPEQCRGEEGEERSDQFALGLIAYEMLAGFNPFRRSVSIESIAAILHEQAPPLPRRVPRSLRRIVTRLLEKDARRRYPDLPALLAELERVPATRRTPLFLAAALVSAILLGAAFLKNGWGPETKLPAAATADATFTELEDEYLRSRYLREKFGEHDLRTIASLEKIVDGDPLHARAWASLARSYANRYFYADPVPMWEEKAFIAVEKALALDPNLADAYVARATLLWTRAHGFPNREALTDTQHAIRLAPGSPDGYAASALILMHVGLFDQAERDIAIARRMQPSDTNWIDREAFVYFLQWKCERAAEIFQRLDPGVSRARALDCAGRTSEAESMLAALAAAGSSDILLATQALFAARRGERDRALRLMDEAIRRDRGLGHLHHVQHTIAEVYARLGETALAVEWLDRAARNGFPSLPTFDLDPDLAGIRNSPEYRKLAARLETEQKNLRSLLALRHSPPDTAAVR